MGAALTGQPALWSVHMRRAEMCYWVQVCRFILSKGQQWSLRKASAVSGVPADTVKRRLKLALDGSGGESSGNWLTKAARDDDWEA